MMTTKELLNMITCCDCLEGMKLIDDKSIDMILCDLPYGITQNAWDSIIDLSKLWKQYRRIIKDNGVIVLTAQTPFDKVLGNSAIDILKYEWIWYKKQGTGHLNAKKMPLKIHENILVFYKQLPSYNPQNVHSKKRVHNRTGILSKCTNYGKHIEEKKSIYSFRCPTTIIYFNNDIGFHPTQKPVKLFEYLIKTYTNENDLVLDNCIGSGTTAVACKLTGRNYIGFEMSQKYCDIAEKRIKSTQGIKEGLIRWDKK